MVAQCLRETLLGGCHCMNKDIYKKKAVTFYQLGRGKDQVKMNSKQNVILPIC